METKKDIEQIAYEYSLDVVETTSSANGYPSQLHNAILVDDSLTWDEIEEIAKENNLEIIELHKRDGWELWARGGKAYELYEGTRNPEFNDATRFFEGGGADDFWKEVRDTLSDCALNLERKEFIKMVMHYNEIADCADTLGDDEFIAYTQYKYDTYPKRSASLVGDTHYYNLALIEA